MAYSEKEKDKIFNHILREIEEGRALRTILKKDDDMPSTQTFYKWLEEDGKSKQYEKACEGRADKIFEEILDIADDSSNDSIELENRTIQNSEFVNRSRLRVDARKWVVSKLHPKKYGDKIYGEHKVTNNYENVPEWLRPPKD